ncbi:hypothetical protein DB88DRAFT_475827 [Papiliotrema laurentii]|uniref:Uncharacterized protein n=1 Tax=Papiliotrema laurentii TaxID=5418 RepID=A0AAD9CWT5_PAPLA|nr:hypothetical protein DB88DRAFT_475827 [Papiliotrema laurentii]
MSFGPASFTRSPTYVSTSSLDSLVVPISEESIDTFGLPGGTVVRFENQACIYDLFGSSHHNRASATRRFGLREVSLWVRSATPGGDIRCVVESQAFALADVLDMLDLGDLITDTLIVRADWMGWAFDPPPLRASHWDIHVPYPLTETGPNSLSSPTASDQTHTPTPLTTHPRINKPFSSTFPCSFVGPLFAVGFASNTLSEPSQKIMAAHTTFPPLSRLLFIHAPPCRIPLETASQEGNDVVSTAPCYLPPLMMQLGSWESTLYPAYEKNTGGSEISPTEGLFAGPSLSSLHPSAVPVAEDDEPRLSVEGYPQADPCTISRPSQTDFRGWARQLEPENARDGYGTRSVRR